MEGTEGPNKERIWTLRKKTYKYVAIYEADNITQIEMKEKI